MSEKVLVELAEEVGVLWQLDPTRLPPTQPSGPTAAIESLEVTAW